jgi:hypothetical protein
VTLGNLKRIYTVPPRRSECLIICKVLYFPWHWLKIQTRGIFLSALILLALPHTCKNVTAFIVDTKLKFYSHYLLLYINYSIYSFTFPIGKKYQDQAIILFTLLASNSAIFFIFPFGNMKP